MIRDFIAYLKDEDGQTSTEYILLVVVVAAIIIKFREQLEERLLGMIGKVFHKTDDFVDDI